MTRSSGDLPKGVERYWSDRRPWTPARETPDSPGSAFVERMEAETLEFVASLGDDLVVSEFCCGSGDLASRLAALPNVRTVFAVDINSAALDVLRERVRGAEAASKLTIVCGDCSDRSLHESLPALDVVVCLNALMHVADIRGVLGAYSSDLKPGGHLIANFSARETMWRHYTMNRGLVAGTLLPLRFVALNLLFRQGYFSRAFERLASRGIIRTSFQTAEQVHALLAPDFSVRQFRTDIHHFVIAEACRQARAGTREDAH